MDYQEKYQTLKRKLKILLYEQESFQKELEKSQIKLLRVSRDKSFLLDRLLLYEQVSEDSLEESDATLSSDNDIETPPKKRNIGTSLGATPKANHDASNEKPPVTVSRMTDDQGGDHMSESRQDLAVSSSVVATALDIVNHVKQEIMPDQQMPMSLEENPVSTGIESKPDVTTNGSEAFRS